MKLKKYVDKRINKVLKESGITVLTESMTERVQFKSWNGKKGKLKDGTIIKIIKDFGNGELMVKYPDGTENVIRDEDIGYKVFEGKDWKDSLKSLYPIEHKKIPKVNDKIEYEKEKLTVKKVDKNGIYFARKGDKKATLAINIPKFLKKGYIKLNENILTETGESTLVIGVITFLVTVSVWAILWLSLSKNMKVLDFMEDKVDKIWDKIKRMPYVTKLWWTTEYIKDYINDSKNKDKKERMMKMLLKDEDIRDAVSKFKKGYSDEEELKADFKKTMSAWNILNRLKKVYNTNKDELEKITIDLIRDRRLQISNKNQLHESRIDYYHISPTDEGKQSWEVMHSTHSKRGLGGQTLKDDFKSKDDAKNWIKKQFKNTTNITFYDTPYGFGGQQYWEDQQKKNKNVDIYYLELGYDESDDEFFDFVENMKQQGVKVLDKEYLSQWVIVPKGEKVKEKLNPELSVRLTKIDVEKKNFTPMIPTNPKIIGNTGWSKK